MGASRMTIDDLAAKGKAISERWNAERNSHVLEDIPLPPEPDRPPYDQAPTNRRPRTT